MNVPELYVGIGASAGGLEAIEGFFKSMPSGNRLAFIVIQHLSPNYKSLMVELLSKKTDMPVLRAEDGMEVEPGSIYLLPPKKNLTIFHGKLILNEQDHSKGINLPIDVFLRSLAEDQGEKAVAIILSGTGSDGMRGIRAIKEHGGMVMVQDEETAKFDGMPRAAISTGLADFVLPPEKMPKQLLSFLQHPRLFSQETGETAFPDKHGLNKIFALIKNRTKADFTYYKPATVNRRIERRMTINQIEELEDYVDYLERYPGEVIALYKELLIGVTSFFRDVEAFEIIRTRCLPAIFENAENREIRLWSAGCSTGEEAYSLAILAREYAESLGLRRNVKIFATDIDKDAIQYAANGVYPESIAADVEPAYLAKYFHRNNEDFQISRMIREMVVFAQHNLIKDPPFTNIDLVSCRNLLIYLQPVMQKKALECFNFSLRPGGHLFLGTSETTGDLSNLFDAIDHKCKIFISKGIHKNLTNNTMFYDQSNMRMKYKIGAGHNKIPLHVNEEERLFERFIQTIIGEYFPTAVIVNENMEVIHAFGETEGFFKMAVGRATNDVTKMARNDLAIPLATGLQKVFKQNAPQEYTIKLRLPDKETFLRLSIKPLPRKKGHESLAAIFLQEAALVKKRKGEGPAIYDLNKEAEERIKDLEHELQFTKENLQATIEELETSNEELQATNEELLASNEELQSTNEELQSTNEELHTVNAEHQSKIFELTELHNDIDNILTGTRIGILLLDENMAIRRFSPQIQKIFTILDQDVGRPFTHLSHQLENLNLTELVAAVLRENSVLEREVKTRSGDWYLMRIQPYAIGPRSYSGVVLTLVDIGQVKKTQRELEESRNEMAKTAELAKIGSFIYQGCAKRLILSDASRRIFGLNGEEDLDFEVFLARFPPDDRDLVAAAFAGGLEKAEPFDQIAQFNAPSGESKWLRLLGRFFQSSGDCDLLKIVCQDITRIKSVEMELNQIRQTATDIIRHMPSGLFIYQFHEGGLALIDGNAEAERITGKRIEDWVGKDFAEIWPEAQSLGILDRFKNVLRSGEPYLDDMLTYDDESVKGPFRVAVFPLTGDRLAVTFELMTERKVLKENLKRSEERYRRLFETMSQGVVYQDASGQIIDANPAAERILGLSLDQMRGRTSVDPRWRAVRPDGSDFPGEEHPSMVALREGREVKDALMGVHRPDSEDVRWIRVSAYPSYREGERKPFKAFATFDDVTDKTAILDLPHNGAELDAKRHGE